MSTTTLFSALAAASIDKAAGTILGVSVISEGEAKGHSLFIDATTLAQVKAAAELFADGLQVKIDHWSGFDGIVGVLKNFSIDGPQLRADLSLLQTHDARERILEMSETMPPKPVPSHAALLAAWKSIPPIWWIHPPRIPPACSANSAPCSPRSTRS